MAVTVAEAPIWENLGDNGEIWRGSSFLQYHQYRELLSELPVSAAAAPTANYEQKRTGSLDYVYGELIYSLAGYEGYLRDKAWPLTECHIRAVARPGGFILEFDLAYHTKAGEPGAKIWQVLRQGESKYFLFLDYYRPL